MSGVYVGDEDLVSALRVVTSGDTAVGERLYAVVLAAAMGTPFVALEYRPKLFDFARPVGRKTASCAPTRLGGSTKSWT